MNSFKVSTSKLTGRPDQAGWSQVFDYIPEDLQKLSEKGRFYAVVSSKNLLKEDNYMAAEQEILFKLRERYYSMPGMASLKRLKEVVEKTIKEFGFESGVQVGILVHINSFVYLVSAGGAKIYVVRDGNFVALAESNQSEVKSASGVVKNDDIFLVSTDTFFRRFAKGIIKASLTSKEIETVIESFAPLVRSLETSGDIGLLLLKFTEDQVPEYASLGNAETKSNLFETKINTNSNSDKLEDIRNDKLFVPKKNAFSLPTQLAASNFVKKLFERKLYINEEVKSSENYKKRKVSALAGLLLLFLLSISIFFGIRQKKTIEQKNSYEKELSSAKHDLEEAQNLASLNPDRSRELFLQGRGKVLSLSDSGIKDPELESLKKNIEEVQTTVLGEYNINPESFIDLSLLSDGFNGTDVVLTDGFLYILDKNSKKLAKVTIENKRSEIVAGPSKIVDDPTIAAYLDNIYIGNKDGIFDISDNKKKLINSTWQGSILQFAYASNLYVLDKSQSKILRFSAGADKFSDGKEWLSNDVLTDLTNATDMVIDGNIWVLTQGSEIYKFTSGNQQKFKLASDFKDLKPDYLYTGDGVEGLYLLDKEGKRIIVFTKEGEYKVQYKSEEIKDTRAFVVSEKDNKIFLLNDSKLLSIELKHL